MSRVAVIGGGAAGLMAASKAAENGAEVILFEKNKRPGRKICITGKGRCNITNKCSNSDFIQNVVSNPRFLYSAINAFNTDDTIDFFEYLGVSTKVERGNRVFPVSDKALDVANALEKAARRNGVRFICETTVKDILFEESRVKGVVDNKGNTYEADAVIIATGGKSYPQTGSTGDGYAFARKLGHTVVPPKASLIPLECGGDDLEDCASMQGLGLKNVGVKLLRGGKEIENDFGELLFTHFGLSGPTVLSLSAHINDAQSGEYTISVDLKPALDEQKLNTRLQRDFDKYSNRELSNSLGDVLPSSMIPVVLRRFGDYEGLRSNSITREQRQILVDILKNLTFKIKALRPINEAIITRGGISVTEINPKTMESKIIDGLFFCGEVLDVDAYTGGFNLQIAFSTGFLAGENAAWI